MRTRRLIAAALALGAAGCQPFSKDGGMDRVAAFATTELGKNILAVRTREDAVAARAKVDELLRAPLTADGAVQLALLNNRGLQAAFNDLFLAEAMAVEASLPPTPTFSIARMVSRPEIEIERQIVVNLLALATLPARTEIAKDRLRAAQFRAAEAVARIAADTRRAYYRAVGAQQIANLLAQSQGAASAATQMARRMGETGALNRLDQAREQLFFAELSGQLATARQRARAERERLTRLMGLWGADLSFRLPPALPATPARAQETPEIEKEALRRRVDFLVARAELDALSKTYGLAKATRFLNLLEIRGQYDSIRERAEGHTFSRTGFEIEFAIPIWDLGEARDRQAAETYLAAANRLANKAVIVRSEAREAYRAYRATHAIARHYANEILPLRRIVSEETLLRYNAMLIDVFPLLNDVRQRLATQVAAIEAQRDFWLADAELKAAVVGGGGPAGSPDERSPTPASPADKDH